MDLNTLYHRTVEHWADVVVAVRDDQWDCPTPCTEWTVRDLVNHVTSEDLWTAALMAGRTIEEVGSSLDGDLLAAARLEGDARIRALGHAARKDGWIIPGCRRRPGRTPDEPTDDEASGQ